MKDLALAIGWIIAIFIAALEAIIIFFIVVGKININKIISDENGDASLSRFQFLIFTFVVAMSLFYLVVKSDPPQFPPITPEILGLLGISSASYVIAKGIQASRDTQMKEIRIQENTSIDRSNEPKNGSGSNGSSKTPEEASK
jgi:hypothetical protein